MVFQRIEKRWQLKDEKRDPQSAALREGKTLEVKMSERKNARRQTAENYR